MAWFNSFIHGVGNVASPVLQGVGTVVPGAAGKQLKNTGKAISNPNVTLSNPSGLLTKSQAFTQAPPSSGGQKVSSPQNMGGADELAQGDYVSGGGAAYGYGGGGSGAKDYSPEYRKQIQDKFNTLQSVFNSLFGKIDDVYKQKAQEVNSQYDTQESDLNKTYQDTLNGTNLAYAGRGLGNSSYLGTALDGNTNVYTKNLNEIGQNRSNANAQLGSALTSAKATAQAQLGNYQNTIGNLGNYSEGDLATINGNIGTDLQNAQVQNDTMLTNPEFQARLAAIAPVANTGSEQLKTQLSNLVNSSAPASAKRQIAKSLIARSTQNPNDQGTWSNYFDSLLSGAA